MLLSISISFICQTISITQFCKAAPYWVLIATPSNLCFCYYVYMCVYCSYLLYNILYYIKCCVFNILLVRFCIMFAKFFESISACCSSKPMLFSYFDCCFMIFRTLLYFMHANIYQHIFLQIPTTLCHNTAHRFREEFLQSVVHFLVAVGASVAGAH